MADVLQDQVAAQAEGRWSLPRLQRSRAMRVGAERWCSLLWAIPSMGCRRCSTQVTSGSKHGLVLGAAALQEECWHCMQYLPSKANRPQINSHEHLPYCRLLLCAPEDVACLKSAAASRDE